MPVPLRQWTNGGRSLLAVGIAMLVVGLVIGFQDAAERNFGRPKVLKQTTKTINGVRDELLIARRQAWPLFWEPAVGYKFEYLQGTQSGHVVWAVSEHVLIQSGSDGEIVHRISCTSGGFRVGAVDVLGELDCKCWEGKDCVVADLDYLVSVRLAMGLSRSHSHVPFFTRRMPRLYD